MNILLVYNPNSGHRVFAQFLDRIIERVQKEGFQLLLYRLDDYVGIEAYFDTLMLDSIDRIWVAGGDGTLNTVINALLRRNIELPIGILPMGTANDFAHYFDFPKELDELLDIALGHVCTPVDIGRMNDRYFINVASLGALVDVSQKTDTITKNTLGKLAYYIKGIEELPQLKPIDIQLTLGEVTLNRSIYFMLIMNGKSAGGFKKLGNFADVSDGLFDVIIFNKCPVLEVMNLLIKVLNGVHVNSDYVEYYQTNELMVESSQSVPSDVDGEVGSGFPLHIVNEPRRLRILTKNGATCPIDAMEYKRMMGVKKVVKYVKKSVVKKSVVAVTQIKDISRLICDFPRHSALYYVNKNSLSKEYFLKAEKALMEPYIYLVLSQTGSPAGELIRKFTCKQYSHASLSFDGELETLVSYNGGTGRCFPGLNCELVNDYHQKADACLVVYKIKATFQQKKRILDKMRLIDEQGSSYNYLGFLWSYTFKENIMFCSQFVYSMLEVAELHYFDKKPSKVMPMDFLELDIDAHLEFCSASLVSEMI
ncbi:MAG: YegS/Rv2252/BmrU family lipid kinase [Clostridia bacterium]|nr:YegS/Rv2252/BmrU family lipid kinase [Clostridia bacterium]